MQAEFDLIKREGDHLAVYEPVSFDVGADRFISMKNPKHMNRITIRNLISPQTLFTFFALFMLTGCQVEQTQEGELPDVDVSVDEGQLPAYDVDVADVDVSLTEKTVKVPKVIVVMEEVDVQVPVIDVDMPGKTKEEMTYTVELEVKGEGHAVEIEDVHLVDGKVWVISRLNMNDAAQTDAVTRISDRIILNAPEDFEVRHYIIGNKPTGSQNNQYRFISSKSSISSELSGGRELYSR